MDGDMLFLQRGMAQEIYAICSERKMAVNLDISHTFSLKYLKYKYNVQNISRMFEE